MGRRYPTWEQLEDEYTRLIDTMEIKASWVKGATRVADNIRHHKGRYEAISRSLGNTIPWQFIGVIHNLECGLSFAKHLHNGNSLRRRTTWVPKNRPPYGRGPYTFEESAKDALSMKGFHNITEWTPARMAFELEKYNGWGYRMYHPSTLSPYLWSGSNHYRRGKYIADGKWSSSAVSKQLGAMVVLSLLLDEEAVSVPKNIEKEKNTDKMRKTSRKMRFMTRVRQFLLGAVPVGFFSWETISQVKTFVNDNAGFILLGLGIAAFLAFKYLEMKHEEDYKEGRYTPSEYEHDDME